MFPLSSETHSHNIDTPNPLETSQANIPTQHYSIHYSEQQSQPNPIPTGTLTQNLIPNPYNPNPTHIN
jgi:hypothetical protein